MEKFFNKERSSLFLLLFMFFACINNSSSPGEGIFQNLSALDFTAKIKAKEAGQFLILDVRTPGEYDQIHLTDAINLDFYEADFKTQLDTLDKEKAYFIYCRSGNRSGKAMAMMKTLGFKEVYNLARGIFVDTEELPVAE